MNLPGLCSVVRSGWGGQETPELSGLLLWGECKMLWLCCSFSPMVPNQITFLEPFTVLLWLSSAQIPGLIVGFSWGKWVYTISSVLEVSLWVFSIIYFLS